MARHPFSENNHTSRRLTGRVTSRVMRLENLSTWRPVKGNGDPREEKNWKGFTRSWTSVRWGCRETDFKISVRKKILDNVTCFKMESAALWDGVTTVRIWEESWMTPVREAGIYPCKVLTAFNPLVHEPLNSEGRWKVTWKREGRGPSHVIFTFPLPWKSD